MKTLDDAEHRFVATPAGRIHVAIVGEGPTLLLLHGWPEDHRAWREVVPLLADGYRLILPDLRGFGQSDAPAGDYRKSALADDILAVMDALELDRVGLVGHDWGGWVGFILALRHPERFSGYVVCNIAHPWARVPRDPRKILPFFYMPIVATPWLGPLLLRRTNAVRGLIRGGTAKQVRLPDPDIAAFQEMIGEPDRSRASSALYRAFLLRELPAMARDYRGKKLEIPVQVVFGRQDPAVHRSLIEGLERKAPEARYLWLDDAGHFPAEEQPEATAGAIRAFFADFPPL